MGAFACSELTLMIVNLLAISKSGQILKAADKAIDGSIKLPASESAASYWIDSEWNISNYFFCLVKA